MSNTEVKTPDSILRDIRVKNVSKIIRGMLDFNSLASKIGRLRENIGKISDILKIQGTKLDSSYPVGQS